MRRLSLLWFLVVLQLVNAQIRTYTIDEIYSDKVFQSSALDGFKWKPDGKSFSFLRENKEGINELFERDCEGNEEVLVIEAEKLRLPKYNRIINIGDYQWSENGKYILLSAVIHARKLKTGGSFYIFDVEEDRITRVVETESLAENIYLSPDGKKAAFVRDNNLWVYFIENDSSKQITFDGSQTVLNGKFDWVYEEEFETNRAYQWAPDSRSIAFWRSDQSMIPTANIPKYDSLYPYGTLQYYPKAGMKNSIVKIGVHKIETHETIWADLGGEKDIYIPRIQFTSNPDVLSIQRLDRRQQKLDLLFVNTANGQSSVVLHEESETWVDIYDDLTFLKDGKSFIWSSRKDNFKHLYLYSIDGRQKRQLTSGRWEVDQVLGMNLKQDELFFTSNERGVLYHDLYKVKLTGSDKARLTDKAGWHEVLLARGGMYFKDEYSNYNQPGESFLCSTSGTILGQLSRISNPINKYFDFGESRFLRFNTSDGMDLQALILLPPGFDSSRVYPVLMFNYSGPGSQIVKDKWDRNRLWHNMLSQMGYIIFMLDNRGTGYRGKQFEEFAYRQLGQYDAGDMIEGAKYLRSLRYVDKSRIGIWGWSYGGYCAALSLMKAPEYFKTAVAVAPVTDWLLYDDVYTERYMSLPQLNPEGYKAASLLPYVKNMQGKLLLVHGIADDNVHFQNSTKLVKKLVEEGKMFSSLFYPDKEHSILGATYRKHLFKSITEFILKEL